MEYALPIGNGEFGAMVYGGIHRDRLQFNDKSVWTGSPKIRGSYQSFGDLYIEDLTDVFIENEYIKVMVLPELGGRVQMAYDKIKQRHFVYYNHVIKPALVGLAGPWISGGMEFNRPSTYMPVDCTIEEHPDDSVTVWVSEMERMFHQKGMAGFTLRPGCAYLEIKGVLYNRTDLPQTFLWWANPAVAVNDHYRSVFPPDINAVFDHGKRAVSSFPIATGTYYKMDYSAGVDIANYKNIFVPTSYMGVNSKYDFEGGYECDTQAGMLHVASHHVSPGKKQWTWGNGDFGRAWDRCLTDDDGPYIELMAGVYTENQPDFTWLMPYEEKEFTQYFLPYRELGVVKNASKDLLLNIEPADGGKAHIKIFATSAQTVVIRLTGADGHEYLNREVTITPEKIFEDNVDTSALDSLIELMHGNAHNYDEIALDFCAAGLWPEAEALWKVAIESGDVTPKTRYYLGWALLQAGDEERARKEFAAGAAESPDMVFPNRLEAISALRAAIAENPADAFANHYLGNLFYDKRQYDLAQAHWEHAAELKPDYPTVWRNLALLYYNKRDDASKALECMERAFSLDETDSRVLMELDQLYKKLQHPHADRLAFLRKYPSLIDLRDDLVLEEITLLNQTGRYHEAMTRLDGHKFHPWEGGEGKVPMQYQTARVELAKVAIAQGNYAEAVDLLTQCLEYPYHLGEGKLYGAQENDFYYLLGVCHRATGNTVEAERCFRQATLGPTEPAAAMYYNDAKPDKIFYAGLAFRTLLPLL